MRNRSGLGQAQTKAEKGAEEFKPGFFAEGVTQLY